MFDKQFTPTYTFVYDCLISEKPADNTNIWLCVSCHKCEETCPYEVAPISFIEVMKEEALRKGVVHPTVAAELQQIVTTGYAFPLTPTTDRLRQGLGLATLQPRGVEDLKIVAMETGLESRLKEVKS